MISVSSGWAEANVFAGFIFFYCEFLILDENKPFTHLDLL